MISEVIFLETDLSMLLMMVSIGIHLFSSGKFHGLYSRSPSFYHLYQRYFNVSEVLFTVLYSDDACVLLGGKYIVNSIICLNNELKTIKYNKLTLNVIKTDYIMFHRARIKVPYTHSSLCMNNSTISKNPHFKYIYRCSLRSHSFMDSTHFLPDK